MNSKAATSAIVQIGIALSLLFALMVWAYWTTLAEMTRKWAHDPQYAHGYLVPVFALAMLWLRRARLKPDRISPSWWGLPVLLAAVTVRLVGVHYYFEWFDFISLLPCLFGLCLLLGGWHALRWSWPALAFLFFMIPLPFSVEVALRDPLRQIGTRVSTYLMQTIGLPAFSEGNVIVVNDFRIGVVEACSGLRMLLVFFALSTAVAMLSERRAWERIVLVFSAVPIALISNIARITVTGVLYVTVDAETAQFVFHDLSGWLMMPFALILLWIECWLLSHLYFVYEEQALVVAQAAPKAASQSLAGNQESRPHIEQSVR